ncbi:MAG: tRNA (guanosine(37)-N1)-methyltransferase TrmD [Deltaproteobacteria bacterium]|nr:tRNA (guanosine(37)-N1)-methyltransferase TrmD [Deltaproteobacteria bacterium]
MRFNILTIFPEFFSSVLSCGLLSRAVDSGLVDFQVLDLREFSQDKHRNTDDRVYGGGPGMVMMADPPLCALKSLGRETRTLLLTPRGRVFDQNMARDLAGEREITIVCGRYEGIDARLEELWDLELVSLGQFVLNGGESAAMCLVEAVSRLLPGFMHHAESAVEESFSDGLLEYPHYTRPELYEGLQVPEVLRSGHHGRIAAWRREQSLRTTLRLRPGLLAEARLTEADMAFLREEPRLRVGRNLHLALIHHPVLNRRGEVVTTSLTNLDVHDIARVCSAYGLGGYVVCTPVEEHRRLARVLVSHWTEGGGGEANPDRRAALSTVQVVTDLQEARESVRKTTGQAPLVLATSAREGFMPWTEVARCLEVRPVLLVLGTGSGLADEVLRNVDGVLRPIRFMDPGNHLSVRSAASIMVDRILGDAR